MIIDFKEIKAEAERLLIDYNLSKLENKHWPEHPIHYYEAADPKIIKAMLAYYTSFQDAQLFMLNEYNFDSPLFNKAAGFTLEYRDAMQDW